MTAPVAVYVGARVFTCDTAAPWADALAVEGRWIKAVGTRAEVLAAAGPGAEIRDFSGKVIVPGFIDAHNHYLATAEALSAIDLRYPTVASIVELARAISRRVARTPAGRWIRGYGMDYAKYPEARMPTRWDLDAVTTDHPVIAYHVSGHYALANSAALSLRGISDDVSDPPGGRFVRDGEGRLTGLCLDSAMNMILPVAVDIGSHGPNFHTAATIEELVTVIDQAGPAYHAAGLTCVCDPQVTRRELAAYRQAQASQKLHVRVACMPLSHQLAEYRAIGLAGPFGSEDLRITGMKFYADGSLIGGTAAFSEPWGKHEEFTGSTYWSAEQLAALLREGHEAGWQLGVHAQGDQAIQMTLDGIENAITGRRRTDARPRIEHAGYPTPAQVLRMRDLGVITVNQPSYLFDSGEEFLSRLGARAERLQPLREELDAGVRVVLSSDSFVASYQPLDTIRAAISRRTRGGQPIGADQAITVAEAVKAHTIDATYAICMEHLIGSLEAGKLADFAVLSGDPFTSPPTLETVQVEATSQGGRVVWDAAREPATA